MKKNRWLDEIENPKGSPLDYKNYEQYYQKNLCGKGHWVFKFENNYGASVIKKYGSYGYEKNKFELAVLKFDGNYHRLCYDTRITNNVIGYLTNEEVIKLLEEIKKL